VLKQPIETALEPARHILLAGAGGGYDLLGAVPLLVDLEGRGKTVSLASLTFCDYKTLAGVEVHPSLPNLASVNGRCAVSDRYCPEAWLAEWLSRNRGLGRRVWLFDKTGVAPLGAAYRTLARELGIDAVILVDGGIDAVLRGDETSIGTPGEDLASLAAATGIEVPCFVACLGMTAELRDGICHAQFLARVAELARLGGFLGVVGLSPASEAGVAYERALEFVTARQPNLRQSHVQRVIRAAMSGAFGADAPDVWLSPLLPMFWFFDAEKVAASHLFLNALENTKTAFEVTAIIEAFRKTTDIRPPSRMPI
jgi:hypothetical protein